MADADHESLSVEKLDPGLILIQYHQRWRNGVHLGGDFIFGLESLPWLIENISLAADDNLPNDTLGGTSPDHIKVYLGGGQRYDDVNVNAHNQREQGSAYYGLYVITGMPRETAAKLIEELRTYL